MSRAVDTVFLSFEVPRSVVRWLDAEAREQGISRSALCRRYLVAAIRLRFPAANLDWMVRLEAPPEEWR